MINETRIDILKNIAEVKSKQKSNFEKERKYQIEILKLTLKLKGDLLKNKLYCIYTRLIDITTSQYYVEGSITSSEDEIIYFKKENNILSIKSKKKEFSFNFYKEE